MEDLKTDTSQWLVMRGSGEDEREEITIAAGTRYEQKLTFVYPLHFQSHYGPIFRALIEEIDSLKARIAKLEEK